MVQSLENSRLTYYPAPEESSCGIGVLVLPGGGYQYLALEKEGVNPALYLNSRGYDAWVLTYSTASTASTPLYPAPQNEALDAIRYIRAQSRVKKLGIWGYSAGGHLAAITVTNAQAGLDFGILSYPVITMDSTFTHAGSRSNLLGDNPTPELVDMMSAEKAVSLSTPPIFLFHTADDGTVPVRNSLDFIQAMAAHGRSFQTLIFPNGPHGIGLALDDPALNWTPELDRWMKYSI